MNTKLQIKNSDGTINKKFDTYCAGNGEQWFKGKQIAQILGYKNTKDAIINHVHCDDKMNYKDLLSKYPATNIPMPSQPQTIFINRRGVEFLVCRSRLPNSINIAEQLNINMMQKVTVKECDIINRLIKVFDNANIAYVCQYQVKINDILYRIDCYLTDYNIAIEIDEFNHKDRNQNYEITRENNIKNILSCRFLRINPDEKDFCIFSFIGKIFKEIKIKQIIMN